MLAFNKLREFIINWQNENDESFVVIPNDEHSSLIFNHGNEIVTFVFSNKMQRDKCMFSIPKKLLENYTMYVNQEEGYTYYTIK